MRTMNNTPNALPSDPIETNPYMGTPVTLTQAVLRRLDNGSLPNAKESPMELQGKTAIVTGAARGIGGGISVALRFSDE